jgi:hypothetical protein
MSQILDMFGRPAAYAWSGTGSEIYESTQDNGRRLARPMLDADLARMMSRHKHRMLLSDARYIAGYAVVSGALDQKVDYVSSGGWLPFFTGKDKAWGEAAAADMGRVLDAVNARGPGFPWERCWRIGCRALDVDGDFVIVHSRTESGFPQVQFIEAHRIGCRHGERIVTSGPYKDLPILNGLIYNRTARPVAVRFLADDPAQDQDISLRDCDYVAHARWFSDGRPLPSIAYAVLDWYDQKTIRGFQKTKQAANSAIVAWQSTETGTAPAANFGSNPVTRSPDYSKTPATELLFDGAIRYLKHGTDLKIHTASDPADGWFKFDQLLEEGALFAMGWSRFMLDPAKLSGAPTRGFQDTINTAIHSRWGVMSPWVLRTFLRILAARQESGAIARHPEWDQWALPPPVDYTVDANKDSQTARANIAFGLSSHRRELQRLGYAQPTQLLQETAQHIADAQRAAKEASRDGAEVHWRDVLNLSPTGQSAYNSAPSPGASRPDESRRSLGEGGDEQPTT